MLPVQLLLFNGQLIVKGLSEQTQSKDKQAELTPWFQSAVSVWPFHSAALNAPQTNFVRKQD